MISAQRRQDAPSSRHELRARIDARTAAPRESSQNRRLQQIGADLAAIAQKVDHVQAANEARLLELGEARRLEAEITEMEAQCDAVEEDLKHYKEVMFEKNEVIQRLKAEIQIDESRIINLRRKEHENEVLWAKNCDTNSFLEHRFNEDVQILSEKLDYLYENDGILSQQKRELQVNLTDCKKTLKEVETENKELDESIIELNREREQLQREVKYLDCSITESRIKADELSIKQEHNLELLETMGIDYERAISKMKQMEQAWMELKNENENLKKQHHEIED